MKRRLMTLLGATLLFTVSPFAADPVSAGEVLPMPVPYSAVAALPAPTADAEESYGEDPLQTLLRFDARGEAAADIVLIHGGCWSADYDRQHTLPLAGALRDAGYRVWLPEYRRVGDPGGGWPGTWQDVQAVLAHVGREAAGSMIAVGHSAGGHLAMLAATTSGVPLAGAIGLAPITDLSRYAAGEGSCQAMAPRLMGALPEAAADAYREASPAFRKPLVPVVILQGEADPIVPMAQATAMSDTRLLTIAEAGHFDLIHPGTAVFPQLLAVLETLSP